MISALQQQNGIDMLFGQPKHFTLYAPVSAFSDEPDFDGYLEVVLSMKGPGNFGFCIIHSGDRGLVG